MHMWDLMVSLKKENFYTFKKEINELIYQTEIDLQILKTILYFSSVQSLSHVLLFVTPWTAYI